MKALTSIVDALWKTVTVPKRLASVALVAATLHCSPATMPSPEQSTTIHRVERGSVVEQYGLTDSNGAITFHDAQDGTPVTVYAIEETPSREPKPVPNTGVTFRDGSTFSLVTAYKEGYSPMTTASEPIPTHYLSLTPASISPSLTVTPYRGSFRDPLLEAGRWTEIQGESLGCFTYDEVQTKNQVYTTILNFLGISYLINSLGGGFSLLSSLVDEDPDDYVYHSYLLAPSSGDNFYAAIMLPIPVRGSCDDCTPEYEVGCFEGNARWMDSCGTWGDIKEYCTTPRRCEAGIGCISDEDFCEPIAACTGIGSREWDDGCGNIVGTDICPSNQYCSDGICYECSPTPGCSDVGCRISDNFEGEYLDTRCRWDSDAFISDGAAVLEGISLDAFFTLVEDCRNFSLELRARLNSSYEHFLVFLGNSYLRYKGDTTPNTLQFGCSTSGGTSTNLQEGVTITNWNTVRLDRQGEQLQFFLNGTLEQTVACYSDTTSQLSITTGSSSTSTLEVDYVTFGCRD